MQKFALKVSMCGVCTTISLLLQLQNMVLSFKPVYDRYIYIYPVISTNKTFLYIIFLAFRLQTKIYEKISWKVQNMSKRT